jgi:hypothetical protein
MATTGYTDVNDFLPEIMQYCNGAPPIMVRIHITNTIIDFCERTLILNKEPSTFCFEEDKHTYTMQFSGDRYVAIAVDSVEYTSDQPSKQPLTRTTEQEMDSAFSNWRNQSRPTPTRYWLTSDINKIRVFPTPSQDSDEETLVRAVVRPKRDQTEFDEVIFEKWQEAIKAGALADVLLVQSGSWFNPRLARDWALKYKRSVNNARKTTLTGSGVYPGRVIPQSFDVMGSNAIRRSGSWG